MSLSFRQIVLLLLTFGLIIYLALWIFLIPKPYLSMPFAPDVTKLVEARPGFPEKEFKEKYSLGEETLNGNRENAAFYRTLHTYVDWLCFFVTTVIAGVAAFANRVNTKQEDANQAQKRWPIIVMGILAAMASFLTACSDRLETFSQSHLKDAVEIHGALTKAYTDFENAGSREAARQVYTNWT